MENSMSNVMIKKKPKTKQKQKQTNKKGCPKL